MPDGELVHIGSRCADAPGPDLLALIIGSEGTLAIVTKVVVRILRKPEAVQTLDTIHKTHEIVDTIPEGYLVFSRAYARESDAAPLGWPWPPRPTGDRGT
jgi:hypothetical protein